MKIKLYQILLLGFLGLILWSCEKDELKKYSGKDSMFFDWSVAGRTPETIDSTGFSFAYDELNVQDRMMEIPISLQGNVSDIDRDYKIEVDENSTAIEGKHFSFEEKTVLRAGEVIDTLLIRVYRTPDMQENLYSIILKLVPNESFKTEMKNITEDGLSFVKLTITVDDILDRPEGWDDLFFGGFSREKLFLMAEILEVEPARFTEGFSLGDLQYYNSFIQRYLDEKKASGETVYEEDGSEMEMGPGLPFF